MNSVESTSKPTAVACKVCGADTQRHFRTGKYWIRQCGECTHQFLELCVTESHSDNVYSDDYFFGGGAGYRNYLAKRDTLIMTGRQYGGILRRFVPHGTVLDVGAAAGFVLEGLAQAGWDGEGLEPNQSMVDYANEMFPSLCHQGTLESFRSGECYDAITMIQVVPHFYNLMGAFTAAERITKPGGVWLIELWNTRSITAQVLGKNWHEYNPPSVLHWFSQLSIRRLASQFGMELIGRGRPNKRICGAHLKSAVEHNFSSGVVGAVANRITRLVPDEWVVPYPGDDVFWVAFRKQA